MLPTEDLDSMLASASDQVQKFILAMNSWERFCTRIDGSASAHNSQVALQSDELRKVFSSFCTSRVLKLQTARSQSVSYGLEGHYRYDPALELIAKATPLSLIHARVETTREHPFPERFAYRLVFRNSIWLIDSKKRFSEREAKWKVMSF